MQELDIANLALSFIGDEQLASLDDVTPTAQRIRRAYEPTRDSLLESHQWNFAIERSLWTPDSVPVTGMTVSGTRPRLAANTAGMSVGSRVAFTAGGVVGVHSVTALDPAWFEIDANALASPWTTFTTGAVTICSVYGSPFIYTKPADCLRVLVWNGYNAGSARAKFSEEGRRIVTADAAAKVRWLKKITDPNEWPALFVDAMAFSLARNVALAQTQSSTRAGEMMQMAERAIQKAKEINAIRSGSWVIAVDGDETEEEWGDGY